MTFNTTDELDDPLLCCCSCIIFNDDFNDDASTILSADWTEEIGNWSYNGTGEISESGTTDAIILTVIETVTIEQHVSTSIDNVTSGRKYRVIVNAVDKNNCWIVEVEIGSPDKVRWFKRVGGATGIAKREEDVQTGSLELESTISVCVTERNITVGFSPVPTGELFYLEDPSLFTTGKKAGLGNGGPSQIEYTDFTLENYRGTDGEDPTNNLCCKEPCMCVNSSGVKNSIPHVLVITLSSFGGCVPPAGQIPDGTTFDLVYYSESGCWESYNAITEFADSNEPQDMGLLGPHLSCNDDNHWIFCCESFPSTFFSLGNNLILGGSTPFDDCISMNEDTESSHTCNPLSVTFPYEGYPAFGDPLPGCFCCDDAIGGGIQAIVTEP